MNKINITFLPVKNLFIKRQPFVILSIILLITPLLLSYVPYVNLVYTIDRGVLIYLLVIVIFIKPSTKFLLRIGVFLLFLSLGSLLFSFAVFAEQLGNIIFFLFAIRVCSIISAYFLDTKHD